MHAAIAKFGARHNCKSCDGPESSSSEGSVRGEEGSLEDRRISQETLDERSHAIREQGLPVRLFLRELPEDESLYNHRKHAEFVEDPNHHDNGYWLEGEPELLWIELQPLSGFAKLRDRRRRHSEAYIIPLCYTDELHRFDLRDASDGIRVAKGLYERLRDRYHGKRATLHGWVQGTTLTLSRRTAVEVNVRGEQLVDDVYVRMFRAAGSFHDRDLQLEL